MSTTFDYQDGQPSSPVTPLESQFFEMCNALDPKEASFVYQYLLCLSQTEAARRVYGVAAAKQKGYAVMRRPDVAAAIATGLRAAKEAESAGLVTRRVGEDVGEDRGRLRPSSDGFVYIILRRDVNEAKIGWSADPERRMRDLQTGVGCPLELMVKIRGSRKGERRIQHLYSMHRIRGEWFAYTDDLAWWVGYARELVARGQGLF